MEKIALRPTLSEKIFTHALSIIFLLIFKTFYRLSVKGAHNLKPRGPYILAVNHTSYFDAFIVASSVRSYCKTNLFFMGYRGYFDVPVVRNLIKAMRIIPLDLSRHMLEAMRSASYVLGKGKILCVFPEGERSINGELSKFKKGIGILSRELDVPIVPVVIRGAFEAWPRVRTFPRLGPKMTIEFGKSIPPSELMASGAKEDYEAVVSALKKEMANLKDETYR
jgi:long-chain acyl-CoA synthetase